MQSLRPGYSPTLDQLHEALQELDRKVSYVEGTLSALAYGMQALLQQRGQAEQLAELARRLKSVQDEFGQEPRWVDRESDTDPGVGRGR